MTQAFNLSQLANNIDSSGRIDATDGLVNAVPVANGGTGASDASAARTNLAVPSVSGSGATGTWGISISGNAATATSASTASTATTATTASTANYATTAGNGGVTSVNGSTGAVSVASATTANVLSATSGATALSVGTYGTVVNGSVYSLNSNVAGSTLFPGGAGTWRCMAIGNGFQTYQAGSCGAFFVVIYPSTFLRIS
jgi:hypothetical protein